jgi:hypothetical protein
MEKILARVIQIVFHPLLISTAAVFILFKTNLYFAFIPEHVREIITFSTLLTTGIIPLIFIIFIGSIQQRSKTNFPGITIIYLFTAVDYYLEYYLISRMPLAGFFKAGFLAGTLVLVSLSLISLRWNISSHLAGVGAMAGVTVALMLRLGVFNPFFLAAVLLAGGLTGFSRLALEKNNPAQVLAGFVLGFGILFSVFSYI